MGARLLEGVLLSGALTVLEAAERANATLPHLAPPAPMPEASKATRPPQPGAGHNAQRAAESEPIELKRQRDGSYK